MSDDHDANFGKSFLTLGWEVVRGQDPRYWLSALPSPGKQSDNDLVRIPAHLVGAHTAIIAQSGSGKSFFLGRLIEELMVQTSASCLVFDPNADFRRIHEVERQELWTEARYDQQRRRGILPHEASRAEFCKRWCQIQKRIRGGSEGELPDKKPYKKFELWWPTVSMAFFAEEVDPIVQSELYHCHDFVKAFGEVFELDYDGTGARKDFLIDAEHTLNRARALMHSDNFQKLADEFDPAKIEAQIRSSDIGPETDDPLDSTLKREIELRVKRFIESARIAANYVKPTIQHFYFGKARQYKTSGIVRTTMRRSRWRKPGHHDSNQELDVVDLSSFGDRNTQMLTIYSILTTTWKHAEYDSRHATERSANEDVRTPTFIIVDEAHNLIPAQTRSKAESAVKDEFRRIIAEGRKYGLFLVVVTQRPDKLDPLILSECENKAIMKLGSESVIEVTRKMLGLEDLSPNLLKKSLEFESGRVLLAGSWCPDGPRICYVAARRTVEGGRSLQTEAWSVPREVMRLKLGPETRKAALELKNKHPEITFSPGHRSIDDHAKQMASALVSATGSGQAGPIPRQLVVMTLSRSDILDIEGELQQQVAKEFRDWLDKEVGDITHTELADWLSGRITQMSPAQRDKVSGHLTGCAFDILPPETDPDAVEKTIDKLRDKLAFKKKIEDGVHVWHLHSK